MHLDADIERLQQDLVEEIKQLRAENERLREALQYMFTIASRALEEGK